ncbi:MFS transporter [Alloalcanivorax sp. C16-1]|uniref:MFS transporter n=1 Tax=Alloalcanivorax sp. C16-1 TaxID=3390051 RepID=UPI003970F7BD
MPYYWRLSAFYFLYFGLLGTLVPYWSLYLKDLGFSATTIGLLMAVPHLTKVVAPNVWGWLADRSGARMRIIRLGNLAAAVAFLPVFWADQVWSMAILLAVFSFFWNAVLAQFEVVTLHTLGDQAHRYSQVRVWGSLGFITCVFLVGTALDHLPMTLLPWVMSALLWLLWLATLALPAEKGEARRNADGGLVKLLKRRDIQIFMLVAFLMQASHGPYYTFYSIHLEEMGFRKMTVGTLWSVAVASEVVAFLLMHRLMTRFALNRILLTCLMLASVRWLVVALCGDSLPWLGAAQLLHSASYACFHAGGIAWVQRASGRAFAGQGQALYSSLGYGAGWGLGSGLSGLAWPYLGVYCFLVAGVLTLAATVLALRLPTAGEPAG